MERIAVVHYDEIGLKGENRPFFERALVRDIARRLPDATVRRGWGRLFIADFSDETRLKDTLTRTPGVASFGIGVRLPAHASREELRTAAVARAKEAVAAHRPAHFAVRVKRVDKTYPSTSQELERDIGGAVFEALHRELPVRLVRPELTIAIELLHEMSVVMVPFSGPGGLPVGVSGKAVALLSGGFDSPVATYKMILRGVTPVALHFHGMPKTSPAAIEKVRALCEVLAETAGPLTLYLVPVLSMMQTIARNAPERLRLVLLRRLMMRVAERVAHKEGAKAIITGESVGQVASQTLENLGVIGAATSLPVLRPLAGSDKHVILSEARAIGTHDISVKPHDDTCSLFVPAHPETRATISAVTRAEEAYDVEALCDEAMAEVEIERIAPPSLVS